MSEFEDSVMIVMDGAHDNRFQWRTSQVAHQTMQPILGSLGSSPQKAMNTFAR